MTPNRSLVAGVCLRAADRPWARATARVQQRRPVRLLGRRCARRVTGTASGAQGAVVELVEAVVGPIGRDGRWVASGLACGDRLEPRDRDPDLLTRGEAAARAR